MASRVHTQREWRLLASWIAAYHPNAEIWMQVRLGPPTFPTGQFSVDQFDINASRLRNRWADAVLYEGGRLMLVEAKMEPEPGIFSTLIHYARKLRSDPSWSKYAGEPLDLIALVARNDPSVEEEAPFYGVTWIVYQPPWLTAEQAAPHNSGTSALEPAVPQALQSLALGLKSG